MKRALGLAAGDRRALLLGGALALAGWLATRGVPYALRANTELAARLQASVTALERAREALAEEPAVRDSLATQARELVAWAPSLVAGKTRAEAVAELSSLISLLAARHHVRVARLDPLPDSAAAPFARVGLRLELASDVAGLSAWLSEVEQGAQLLGVREIQITAPDPAAPATQAETLRAELVVSGWAAPRLGGRP